MPTPDFIERMARYLSLCAADVKVNKFLGGGTDGDVWKTTRDSAVKVFKYDHGYYNEKDSYLRLEEFGITNQIGGFWVPQIVGWDDELMVVEMDVMHRPPYIIDFAKVRLNTPPDFSDDVLQQQELDGLERFEHNWKAVKRLLRELEDYLIYYLDPQRGNITFPDMP